MSKTIEKHIAAIKSGKITQTNVIGLRKAFNARERAWKTRNEALMTDQQADEIHQLLADVRPIVTGTLHETGLAVLRNPRYKRQLAQAADIIADAQGFKLVGFDCGETANGTYTPVYRVFDSKGHSLPFCVVPWQSGGNGPQLMSPNYY
jgi:hypothetical protein